MPFVPVALSGAGAVVVLAAWAHYLSTIPRGVVPRRATGTLALQAGGGLLAVVGIGLSVAGGGPSGAVVGPAGFAMVMAVFFVWLYRQRRVPAGKLRVEVGSPMLPFEVRDDTGAPFHSDGLRGKRVLLKFFRGSW